MSNADKPDGTDPRVLTPDPDEPDVYIARQDHSATKWHPEECSSVKAMDNPKVVSKSIATWNGRTKCSRCERIQTGEDYPRPGTKYSSNPYGYHSVTPVKCLTMRALALAGWDHTEIADEVDVTKSTATRHCNGSCQCVHVGHSVEYTGRTGTAAGDRGVPDDSTRGGIYVPAQTCKHIREILAETDLSIAPLTELFGASEVTIRRHAKAGDKCSHDHNETHPPLRFGKSDRTWVRDV